MTEIVSLIDRFRSGDEDAALQGLIELPDDALADLTEYFRSEALAPIRALIVKAIWERRNPSSIPFLGEALRDPEEEVWQEALDGLVTLASVESFAVLQNAKISAPSEHSKDRRFRLWLEEAIEQVNFELRR